MVGVGVAILALHGAVAVFALVFLRWIIANPPGLAPLVSVFAVVVLVGGYIGYRVGSLQLVARIDGVELSIQRSPELFRRLERLCLDARLSQPRLLVADLGAPNALSIGGPRNSYVVFDRRLFSLLTIEELEGILAHELAHIERRDTFWNTVGVTAARTVVGVGFLFFFPVVVVLLGIERGGAWIAGEPNRDMVGLADYFQQTVLLFLGAVLFLFTLAFYAYSRRQEYAADRRATALTGKPTALARALAKIDRATNPREGLLSMLYIHDERNTPRRQWLSTHPPIDERIDRLLEEADAVGKGIAPVSDQVGRPVGETLIRRCSPKHRQRMFQHVRALGVRPQLPVYPAGAVVLFGDILGLLVFVVWGLYSHQTLAWEVPGYTLTRLAPFLIAWLTLAPLVGLYHRSTVQSYRLTLAVLVAGWFLVAPLGSLIRASSLFSGGASPIFVLVNLVFGLVVLLPWRLGVVAAVRRRAGHPD